MEEVREAPVPAWFWAVAVLALLWEAMGCYQYLMQVRAPGETLPVWVVAAFAVAVWVGLLGAILLLMRRDWARMAFIVSLLAVLVQFGGLYMGGRMHPADAGMPALIVAVAVVLVWFAHYSAKRGWLR
jgi:hypothetical protein